MPPQSKTEQKLQFLFSTVLKAILHQLMLSVGPTGYLVGRSEVTSFPGTLYDSRYRYAIFGSPVIEQPCTKSCRTSLSLTACGDR